MFLSTALLAGYKDRLQRALFSLNAQRWQKSGYIAEDFSF